MSSVVLEHMATAGSVAAAPGGILSICETPERWCELEIFTRASIHKVVPGKWVKFPY